MPKSIGVAVLRRRTHVSIPIGIFRLGLILRGVLVAGATYCTQPN